MAREIERKFLVRDTAFLVGKVGEPIVQGYVAKESGAMSTRVRIRGDKAYLTLKGAREGISRDEFEYSIPVADAMQILSRHCGNRLVQKTRYCVGFADLMFEVDVFGGKHAGLVIAEVELHSEHQRIALPPWVGTEVSADPRYGNFALAQFEGPLRPFDPGRVAPPKFVAPVPSGFADAH